MARTLVVALGGNALLPKGKRGSERKKGTQKEFANAKKAAKALAAIIRKGHRVAITHGNGPQVGSILIRSATARQKTYTLPIDVADAQSEGELGYIIEQTLENELRGKKQVAGLLTQVVVRKKDPAFKKPDKPIGPFYTRAQAKKMQKKGTDMMEDAGRGWRRVVASPRPVDIPDAPIIRQLVERGIVVIAGGGGGIPVVREKGKTHGVDAVIDKDKTSALLAHLIDADTLLILTGVRGAYTGFGTRKQKLIKRASVKEMQMHLKKGEFAPGSMQPKIEAALQFVRGKKGRTAIITDPAHAAQALAQKAGTVIRA